MCYCATDSGKVSVDLGGDDQQVQPFGDLGEPDQLGAGEHPACRIVRIDQEQHPAAGGCGLFGEVLDIEPPAALGVLHGNR